MEIFTVVTPVALEDKDLSFTANSLLLLSQKVKFKWVVVCPQSEFDSIVSNELLAKVPNTKVICEERKSIYGAYNTALKRLETRYYLPLSSGDSILESSADCLVKILRDPDYMHQFIIFFSVFKSGRVIRAHDGLLSLIRTSGFSSGHSSSCLISFDAHKRFGAYDESFKLAADNYFFELVYKNSKDKISWVSGCILGYFKGGGVSVRNMHDTIRELYISRVRSGRSRYKEAFIFLYRSAKYILFFRKSRMQ